MNQEHNSAKMPKFEDIPVNIVTEVLAKMNPVEATRFVTQLGRNKYKYFSPEIKQLKIWYDNIPTANDIVFSANEFLQKAKVTLRAGDPFVFGNDAIDDTSIIPIVDMNYNSIECKGFYLNTVSHTVFKLTLHSNRIYFGTIEIRDNNTYTMTLAVRDPNNMMVNIELLKIFIGLPHALSEKLLGDSNWKITETNLRRIVAIPIIQNALNTLNQAFPRNIQNMQFMYEENLHPVTTRIPKNQEPIGKFF